MSAQDGWLGESAATGCEAPDDAARHARLRAAFDGSAAAMVVLDAHDRVVEVNAAACAMVAVDRQAFVEGSLCANVHPEDLPSVRRALATIRTDRRRAIRLEARVITALGVELVVAFDLVRLGDVAEGAEVLLQATDLTAHRRLEAELRAEADLDPLTGLKNRRSFERGLAAHLAVTTRYSLAGALLLVDVDHFKSVNDTRGHAAGDEVLRDVGRLLVGRLRASDVVGRLGGDEFGVLLPNVQPTGIEAVAAALVSEVRDHTALRTPVTVSVGAATITAGTTTGEVFLRADRALYAAKGDGRDRWALAP